MLNKMISTMMICAFLAGCSGSGGSGGVQGKVAGGSIFPSLDSNNGSEQNNGGTDSAQSDPTDQGSSSSVTSASSIWSTSDTSEKTLTQFTSSTSSFDLVKLKPSAVLTDFSLNLASIDSSKTASFGQKFGNQQLNGYRFFYQSQAASNEKSITIFKLNDFLTNLDYVAVYSYQSGTNSPVQLGVLGSLAKADDIPGSSVVSYSGKALVEASSSINTSTYSMIGNSTIQADFSNSKVTGEINNFVGSGVEVSGQTGMDVSINNNNQIFNKISFNSDITDKTKFSGTNVSLENPAAQFNQTYNSKVSGGFFGPKPSGKSAPDEVAGSISMTGNSNDTVSIKTQFFANQN